MQSERHVRLFRNGAIRRFAFPEFELDARRRSFARKATG